MSERITAGKVFDPPVDAAEVPPRSSAACPIGPRNFGQIYDQHFAFVWRSLRALGLRGATLDDAAQDVFLAVHRRLPEFEGRSSLRTWIFAIVENVALNHRRSAQRKQAPLTALDGAHPSADPGPQERAQDRQVAEFVQAFLEALPSEQRVLFILVFMEQTPAPEVATTLGIPLNTVYSRIRAVKRAFREAAAAYERSSP
jgi:RNA polymerase sigma-70 factor (ECF subfamily)